MPVATMVYNVKVIEDNKETMVGKGLAQQMSERLKGISIKAFESVNRQIGNTPDRFLSYDMAIDGAEGTSINIIDCKDIINNKLN